MSKLKLSLDAMNERLAAAPYSAWLGVRVTGYRDGTLHLEVPWRDAFAGTPVNSHAHGGVLAAVIDSAASYALAAVLGKPLPTIDLRVDYHRPIVAEPMRVESRVVRVGRNLATAEAWIYSREGRLAASGRALFAVS